MARCAQESPPCAIAAAGITQGLGGLHQAAARPRPPGAPRTTRPRRGRPPAAARRAARRAPACSARSRSRTRPARARPARSRSRAQRSHTELGQTPLSLRRSFMSTCQRRCTTLAAWPTEKDRAGTTGSAGGCRAPPERSAARRPGAAPGSPAQRRACAPTPRPPARRGWAPARQRRPVAHPAPRWRACKRGAPGAQGGSPAACAGLRASPVTAVERCSRQWLLGQASAAA